MRIARSITGLALAASIFIPSLASAAAPSHIGLALLPAGFCTVNEDGSIGVRFDGVTYDAWLLEYALANQATVKKDLLALFNGNELVAGQQFGELMKAATTFQKYYVNRGQTIACR